MHKTISIFLFAVVSSLIFLTPLYAVTQQEMGTLINLAGKQRMLTQKMSKEMLLIAKGIEAEKNRENLAKTATLFHKTLKGLIHGDADLNLVRVDSPKILMQLEKVAILWKDFRKNVNAVLAGDISKTIMEKIAAENMPLLRNMNRAVQMYAAESKSKGGGKLDQGMATTLNLSGKQRMLSQKMTKEFLLVALGIDPNKSRRSLRKTSSLFERTLKGLLDGDEGLKLPGTKDPDIRAQLKIVANLWDDYKVVLDKINTGESNKIPVADLKKASRLNLPLLKQANAAVKMYEQSVQ